MLTFTSNLGIEITTTDIEERILDVERFEDRSVKLCLEGANKRIERVTFEGEQATSLLNWINENMTEVTLQTE